MEKAKWKKLPTKEAVSFLRKPLNLSLTYIDIFFSIDYITSVLDALSLNKPCIKRDNVRQALHYLAPEQTDDLHVKQLHGTNEALMHEILQAKLCTYCIISNSEDVCWKFPPVSNNPVISDPRHGELEGVVGT